MHLSLASFLPGTRNKIKKDHAEALEMNQAFNSKMRGQVSTPESAIERMYRGLQVDMSHRMAVLDIRDMDRLDGRVKKVHKKISRDVTKGGLRLIWTKGQSDRVDRLWKDFVRRVGLDKREKLKSDARGAAMEGNLVLQWIVDPSKKISGALRLPSETIVPNVNPNGSFKDISKAYVQIDIFSQVEQASFPFWQLSVARLEPENYDDMGALGRPYLDASRSVWRKLIMTEEDLVIRRRHRAPQKLVHVLEGAKEDELGEYERKVRNQSGEIETDFFMNKKGAVTAIAGDAALDQIADVSYLLDTFFAGSPAPKGLFGYTGDLARDILEDLKRDYYEEIDGLQDVVSGAYEEGFRLELLLHGLNPDAFDFEVQFAERMTETKNQRADYSLKLQALNVPRDIVWREAGLDPVQVRAKAKEEINSRDPYPDIYEDDDSEDDEVNAEEKHARPKVSVTPGNQGKGESSTSITTRG